MGSRQDSALRALAWGAATTCAAFTAMAADVQHGRVVAVEDGHTIEVLVRKERMQVRIAHIDAPTGTQRYAIGSRQSLIAICGSEPALVETYAKERDGTAIGRVMCNGTDAGAEQVRRGMAAVGQRHGEPDALLVKLQAEAQAAKRGVWASPGRRR